MMSFHSRERSNDGRRPFASGVVRPGEGGVPGQVSHDMHSMASIEDLHGLVRRGWRRRPIGRATSRRRSSPSSVVPVLYVGGCQRSGSTLLDRMMSQISGHVSTGEIVHLWSRGLSANELCGCGNRFLACPFWSDVGRVAFGGWGAIDTQQILRLQRRVDRNRYIIFMLLPALSPRYRRELSRYVAVLDQLYRAIHRVGGGVIVDSSKHASTAFILRRVPSVRLRIVHLVRDSRGVAFSLSKRVRRPESVDEETFMFRSSSWRSSIEWMTFNTLFHVIHVLGTPTILARYEALARDPRGVLDDILTSEALNVAEEELGFIDGRMVQLAKGHTVAGNPMRLEHGSFHVRLDDAWRTSMNRRDRKITTALTWPLLAAYGYLRENGR